MSEEKQVEIAEKSETKKEVSYKTWKDELKKESEKAGKVLESKKGDGLPSTVEEKPPVKKQESNIAVVKKKKRKGIECPV